LPINDRRPDSTFVTSVGDPTAAKTSTVDVLLVDDQAPFRDVERTLVSLVAGWRVVAEAETGEDAVAAAGRLRPGLVLMDINLPGISGIEAARQITTTWPQVRVVLLSTYRAEDLPADAQSCGAVAYIHKEDLTPHRLREALAA
jgi:two-component system, NarL family, invasion response regulator UvrY